MKLRQLFAAFSILCAVAVALPREAHAQTDAACAGTCIPAAMQCAQYAEGGAVYNDNPLLPATCGILCTPTRAQCERALVSCPGRGNCSEQPVPDPGPNVTPNPTPDPGPRVSRPRTPPREVPPDVCEAGAHDTGDGSCGCDTGAVGGPLAVYQVGTRRHVQRLQQRDSRGRLHVMCVVPPQMPTPSESGPDCNGLSLCGELCRDLNHDPNNCGSCGHACDSGVLCSAGICVAREQAVPTPPVPMTIDEAARTMARSVEPRFVVLERRVRVRPGLLLGGSFTWTALPAETFMVASPVGGLSLTFDRFDLDGRFLLQAWFQAGSANTGHTCTAIHLEGGARLGYAVDASRIFTPFIGWAAGGDTVPCHAPRGGIEVADGVAYSTGPEAGASLRLYEGLHLNLSARWNVSSRFTQDWLHDFTGVSHVTLGGQLEWRLW